MDNNNIETVDNNIIPITAHFQTASVYLYIETSTNYGYTQPASNQYLYFDPEDENAVSIYPTPLGGGREGIPPQEEFYQWEAVEGSLGDNSPFSVPLTLTMDRNRRIKAHFKKTTAEDGGGVITSYLKDNLQWYFSVHDGYYYKNRSRQDSDNND